MSLSQLKKALPPPEDPVDVPSPQDWDVVASHIGTHVPTDFVEFLSVYGGGTLDEWWGFSNPAREREKAYMQHGSMIGYNTWTLRRYVETHGDFLDGEFDYQIHPKRDGLIAFAVGTRDYLTWHSAGATEDWTIVVVKRGRYPDLEWCEYEGNFTEFLLAVLNGDFHCDFWGDDFPSEDANYKPLTLA